MAWVFVRFNWQLHPRRRWSCRVPGTELATASRLALPGVQCLEGTRDPAALAGNWAIEAARDRDAIICAIRAIRAGDFTFGFGGETG